MDTGRQVFGNGTTYYVGAPQQIPSLAPLGETRSPFFSRLLRSLTAPASPSLDAYSARSETVRADLGRTAAPTLTGRRRISVDTDIATARVSYWMAVEKRMGRW